MVFLVLWKLIKEHKNFSTYRKCFKYTLKTNLLALGDSAALILGLGIPQCYWNDVRLFP